jgi:hypothetical protein
MEGRLTYAEADCLPILTIQAKELVETINFLELIIQHDFVVADHFYPEDM